MSNYIKYKEYIDIKKQILTPNGLLIRLEIYNGFDDIEELCSFMVKHNIESSNVAVVKFLDMYYAICYQSNEEKIIIGKNVNWQSKNYYLEVKNNKTFKPGFQPRILKLGAINPQIFEDLLTVDSDLKIYISKSNSFVDITDRNEGATFAVLLGLTFYNAYFSKYIWDETIEYYFLKSYLVDEPFSIYKMPGTIVLGVNPFRGEQLLDDGSIRKKRFYDPDKNKHKSSYRQYKHRY